MLKRYKIRYQDLVDTMGSEIYDGTNVDEATQNLIDDWFYEKALCDDSIDTFLRYFRRRLRMYYPFYWDELRIATVRGDMDPFVIDYMERVRGDSARKVATQNSTKTSSSSDTGERVRVEEGEIVRTPNLSTHDIESSTRTPDLVHDTLTNETRTPNLTKETDMEDRRTPNLSTEKDETTTRTPDLIDKTIDSGSETGSSQSSGTTHEERDDSTTVNTSSTVNSKGRNFNVTYPEANLGGIPTDVDSYPATIDYVGGESDSLAKSTSTGNETTILDGETNGTNSSSATNSTTTSGESTKTQKGTEQTVLHSEVAETGTDVKATTGTIVETGTEQKVAESTTSETGTETNAGEKTRTETGTDTTAKDNRITDTITGSKSQTDETEGEKQDVTNSRVEEVYAGRHESVADILPRAIAAIEGCNPLRNLIKRLEPCFDLYEAF